MAGLQTLRDAASELHQLLSHNTNSTANTKPSKAPATETQRLVMYILAGLQDEDCVFEESDHDTAHQIASVLAKTMAPILLGVNGVGDEENDDEDDDDDDEETSGSNGPYRRVVQRCLAVSPPAIEALVLLAKKATSAAIAANDDLVLTLAAFTSKTQDWVPSPEAANNASELLRGLLTASGTSREQFIAQTILQHYLRPLFSKSKPASVTASGRKAEYVDPAAGRSEGLPDDSNKTKPWKFSDFRAIALASWAIEESDEQLISKHWPLFIPVLLTLADDSTTRVREEGLIILTKFLKKLPDKTLRDTGLSKVFEDAIFPTLSYLPSLTPEDESIQLLVPAFEALRCLASKQLSATVTKNNTATALTSNQQQTKLLDKIFREGLFTAYFHAKDHIRIVEVLCQQTVFILDQMGIYAVKHLKDLIPMLSTIISDPFAPAAPRTLLSAIKALQAVVTNCWPRIPSSPWQDEIIQTVILCWLNVNEHLNDDGTSPETTIRKELITSVKYLAAVLKAEDVDLVKLVEPLVAKEPSLNGLFSPLG